jgi:hypothetical protein
MPLGVQNLYAGRGITSIAGAIENGPRVVFLRLMVEDENDLAFDIDRRVIVIPEFRCRDTEPGKDNRSFSSPYDGTCAGRTGLKVSSKEESSRSWPSAT